MKQFEISEATLAKLSELSAQKPECGIAVLQDYCNCTGFGG